MHIVVTGGTGFIGRALCEYSWKGTGSPSSQEMCEKHRSYWGQSRRRWSGTAGSRGPGSKS